MRVDPKALKPGTVLRHKTGTRHTLKQRKDDNSGWWLTERGGIADFVLERQPNDYAVEYVPDGERPTHEVVKHALNCALHRGSHPCDSGCTHVVVGSWTALGIASAIGRIELEGRA